MTTRHNPLELYQLDNSSPDELSEKQLALFALLQQREQEFGFNPNVIVHYPEARFLSAPLDYLDQLISEQQQQGQLINEVVILTTYLQVQAPLVERGYRHETRPHACWPRPYRDFRDAIRHSSGWQDALCRGRQ
ncbi:hypothetical protein ACET8I_18110 [Aeromonas veronii]